MAASSRGLAGAIVKEELVEAVGRLALQGAMRSRLEGARKRKELKDEVREEEEQQKDKRQAFAYPYNPPGKRGWTTSARLGAKREQ